MKPPTDDMDTVEKASEVESHAYAVGDRLQEVTEDLDHSKAHESDLKADLEDTEAALKEARQMVSDAIRHTDSIRERSDSAYDMTTESRSMVSVLGDYAVALLDDLDGKDTPPAAETTVVIDGAEYRIRFDLMEEAETEEITE